MRIDPLCQCCKLNQEKILNKNFSPLNITFFLIYYFRFSYVNRNLAFLIASNLDEQSEGTSSISYLNLQLCHIYIYEQLRTFKKALLISQLIAERIIKERLFFEYHRRLSSQSLEKAREIDFSA
jgi:hypothetical protein